MPQSSAAGPPCVFGQPSPAAAAGAGSHAASTASTGTHPVMPHLSTKPASSSVACSFVSYNNNVNREGRLVGEAIWLA